MSQSSMKAAPGPTKLWPHIEHHNQQALPRSPRRVWRVLVWGGQCDGGPLLGLERV